MTDEERQEWIDSLDEQITRHEKRLEGMQQMLENGIASPRLREQFNHLSARVDLMIKMRRDLELRHYEYMPAPKQRRAR